MQTSVSIVPHNQYPERGRTKESFIVKMIRNIGSHTAAVLVGALFIGSVGIASATSGGADGSTDITNPPAMTVWEDPYADTVCAQAPTAAPTAKYSVFQDTLYGFSGNNDRIHIGFKSQGWSNDAFDPNVNPYEDFIRLETRGGNTTRLKTVWVCQVVTRQVATGEVDPIYGYPLYETVVDSAEWIEIARWSQNRPKKADVPRPVIDYTITPNGEYQMTGYVATYVTATGNGQSQITYIGGGVCCRGAGGI